MKQIGKPLPQGHQPKQGWTDFSQGQFKDLQEVSKNGNQGTFWIQGRVWLMVSMPEDKRGCIYSKTAGPVAYLVIGMSANRQIEG